MMTLSFSDIILGFKVHQAYTTRTQMKFIYFYWQIFLLWSKSLYLLNFLFSLVFSYLASSLSLFLCHIFLITTISICIITITCWSLLSSCISLLQTTCWVIFIIYDSPILLHSLLDNKDDNSNDWASRNSYNHHKQSNSPVG